MFKRILVPVDLTRKNLPAVEIALKLAIQSDSRVTLLHVIERIDQVSQKEIASFYKKLEVSAKKKLKNFAKRFLYEGMSVDQVILYGKRAREIIRYAEQNPIDLIVLSSHRVDAEHPNWGSISYAVGILSPCPVMLVK